MKISQSDFIKIFGAEFDSDYSIEIRFCIENNNEYSEHYIGKEVKSSNSSYWFSDGFEFDSYDDMVTSKAFNGKTVLEVLDNITILEIDGCDPYERIKHYIE